MMNDDWIIAADERVLKELGPCPEPPLEPTIKIVMAVGLSTFFATMFGEVPEPTRSIICIAMTAIAGGLTYWHYNSQFSGWHKKSVEISKQVQSELGR